MKFHLRKLEPVILLAVGCCFLLQSQAAAEGTATGLQICATAILPALFPFFVLTDYWVRSGHADSLARFASPLVGWLFHLPGAAASPLIMGSIGGYPVGVRITAQLYDQKQLTKKEAEQLLLFCNNAGPAFVLGVLGGAVFQSTLIGTAVYLIHLFSAFLVGFLFRPAEKPVPSEQRRAEKHIDSAVQGWTQAITNAGRTCVQVCTYVLFFSILTQCIHDLLPYKFQTGKFFPLLVGFLELAGGARALSSCLWRKELQFALSSLLLGWGGLCVMMQSVSIIQAAGLSGKKLFLGKLCQGALSFLLSLLISPFLPFPQPCAMVFNGTAISILPQWILSFLLVLLLWIFLKESSGKRSANRI